jgi:hypothetical protein
MNMDIEFVSDGKALRQLLEILEGVNPSSIPKLISTIATYFEVASSANARTSSAQPGDTLEVAGEVSSPPSSKGMSDSSFSLDRGMSAKEFMLEKRAQTDVERVACLAYYLSHYAEKPNFKTIDISKLNTDAAQLKLSNAAQAVENATKAGFLITSQKGQKKISALGELYVQGLPDRATARAAVSHAKPRRRKSKVR